MSAKNAAGAEAASPDLIEPDMAVAVAKLAEMVAADGDPPTTYEDDREQQARFAPFWDEGAPELETIVPLSVKGASDPLQARLYKNSSKVDADSATSAGCALGRGRRRWRKSDVDSKLGLGVKWMKN
ncbi:hypothetical protein H8A99_05200 [Bradyrhizobium sp. Arg68]|uniref:hypothetical protein n=1 Tax=Bradyrhizobium ivorense TaxID=2511166 RepID=UPI001E49B3D9|nr:hypothetical protein [Bradyrhizobium ivorense]MCC8935902.1 hypothetical protein [Bradyrhizobium ivorense]